MNKVLIGVIIIAALLVIGFLSMNRSSNIQQTNTQQSTPPVATQQATSSAQPVEQNTITLTASGFSPETLTIKAGDKVTWANKSGADAAVNSNPHPVHTDYPPLNLGSFKDGENLSLTFDQAGTYGYHNHLNPSQTGTIVVE